MKGIIIIACGHPYYGRMAAGLAATIKASGTLLPITVLYHGNALLHLSDAELKLFHAKLIPDKYIKGSYLRVKLCLPDLSPYSETLYLDADIAWLGKNPDELFGGFRIKNYGSSKLKNLAENPKAWAKYADIISAYGLAESTWYDLSSECITFTKEDAPIFRTALKFFDKPNIEFRDFAGYMADELALSFALATHDVGLPAWEPIYWRQSNSTKCYIPAIRESFYGFSMGGARATDTEISIYNSLISAAYFKLGIDNPFKWVNKSRFLQERKQY